jgi:hypothetical protein
MPTKKVANPNKKNKKETIKKPSEEKVKVNKVISTCGFLTWWEFKGAESTPVDLKSELDKYDTLKDIDVPSINKMSALTQSIREFRFSKNIRVRAEIASQDENELNINLLERVKVDKKKVEWHRCENLIFDVGSEEWLSKGDSDKEEVQKARDAFISNFDKKSKYLDHNYIRPYVLQRKLRDCGAISLRNRGGIYFVPESANNQKAIMDLASFSDNLGGLEFLVCSMQADSHTKKSLGSQVKKSLETRLKELSETLDNWKDKTRNIRQDSLTQVMAEFSEIRNLTEIYQKSLFFKSEELMKDLGEIESIATNLIIDQKTRGRGVSGAVVKRYKRMISDHSIEEDGSIIVPFKYMEDRAWPDCSLVSRFYKAHNKTSGYKALLSLGYFAETDDDAKTLILTKI